MNGSTWVKDLYITDYTHNPEDPRLYLRRESFIVIGTFVSSTVRRVFLREKFDLTQESDKLFQVALGHQDERFIAFKE